MPFLSGVSRRLSAYLLSATVLVFGALGLGINKLKNAEEKNSGNTTSAVSLPLSLSDHEVHASAKNIRAINDITEQTIKGFEQLRLFAYDDQTKKRLLPGEKPVGVTTIGWGHTGSAKAGDSCTVEEADRLFAEDIKTACRTVSEQVQVPLTDNQYGALVCFAYNVGTGAFSRSTLLQKLNAGNYASVPDELLQWNRQKKKVLPGLTRRRIAEAYLFTAPELAGKTPIESILKKDRNLLNACMRALEAGQDLASVFAAEMKALPFDAPRDQWWLDYLNNAALRSFFSLTGKSFPDNAPQQNQSFNFNVIAGAHDTPQLKRQLFGGNERMRHAFEYIQLAHMEKNLGAENQFYKNGLLQLALKGNPYLNIKMNDLRSKVTEASGKKTPLQIMDDMVASTAPWLCDEASHTAFSFK